MKEQIFISYKRVDKERVFAIKDFIEQNTGAKCWIDLEGIKSNAQFADKIGTAIDNCQVFIFMRSNAHNTITNLAKDWTYREVNYALDEDKNIIVINLDQSPMPKWFKMLFPNKQEIDATNFDMLNRLCDDLCSWLGILKPAAEPDSESQKTAKRDALPKEPFRVGNLTYKASEHGGVSVFGCDKSLEEVHIPAKVEYGGYTYDVDSIGEYAFCGCFGLTSITIPEGVTNIGEYAFEDCSSLTSITIPNSVTSIGEYAFAFCFSFKSITIPEGVTNIGDSAFSGCESLTSIIVEKGNKKYDSRENCNAIIETATNTLIRGCDNTIIPDTITGIGNSAFDRCKSLTSISIPESVTTIGDNAFSGCYDLTSITIPNSVTSIGRDAFCGCKSLTTITIPDSVTSIGGSAFWCCENLTTITIPNSVTSIGDSAFFGCKSLTSITIPDSVTSIADHAFDECSSLREISISKKLTSIGKYAIPIHTRVRKRGSIWPF